MIDVIIPVRDKEKWRLIKVIDRLKHPLVRKIVVVDYGSKKPVKINRKNVFVVRYDKTPEWNKAHAINIGFKHTLSNWVMTLDADILLSPGFFDNVYEYTDQDTFIYTNKVKRIYKDDLNDDWETCLGRSYPWHESEDPILRVHHTATGGFQIFPRWWFDRIKGLDENLVYYGGMDNITVAEAKREGLNLVILNETVLHLEHGKKKEENLPEEEREFATYLRSQRNNLMRQMLDLAYQKNPGFWGSTECPNYPIFLREKEEFQKAQKEGKGFEFPRNTKIMIAIINNRDSLPERFVRSLIDLYNHTSSIFPNTTIHYIKACQVNHMRNLAVQKAIEEEQDYLVQLDVDHIYPNNFIVQLLGRNLDFITGCTKQRTHPYYPTQYYKFKNPLKEKSNIVFSTGEHKITKIEVSGPVGMLMKVSALKQLEYPYYFMDYSYYINGKPSPLGGDYVFTRQLKEKGFELYLDESVQFPHFVEGELSGQGNDAKIDLR